MCRNNYIRNKFLVLTIVIDHVSLVGFLFMLLYMFSFLCCINCYIFKYICVIFAEFRMFFSEFIMHFTYFIM